MKSVAKSNQFPLERDRASGESLLAGVARKLRAAKIAEAEALEELIQLAIHAEGDRPPDAGDQLVDAQAASVLIGMSLDWLYRNAHRLSFARRVGGRSLRFSTLGIRRWLELEGRV
jgi:hypothetical protein